MEKFNQLNSLLVSIVVPAYNCEKYIAETLSCLLNQTWKHTEIIVVNDGSTDATLAISRGFEKRGVKIIEQENCGAASARNRGFLESTGGRIIFFDADDFVNETFIESQMHCLGTNEDTVCISAWGRFYKEDKSTFVKCTSDLEDNLSFSEWIQYYWRRNTHTTPPGRVIVPRSLIQKSGLWLENLSLNDDFEFFTRVFAQTTKILYNGQAIFYYRSDVGGLSSRRSANAYESNLASISSAINVATSKYLCDQTINVCCANTLQSFVYETYPDHPNLIHKANVLINELAVPDYPFPCGGITKILSAVFGWKLTKRFKLLFGS